MKIVVLAGGLSNERDVSLSSSSLIANALLDNGHKVILVDVYKGLEKITEDIFETSEKYEFSIPDKEPDIDLLIKENNNRKEEIGLNVLEICKLSDIVFIGLHGGIGENGKLQALLDMEKVKYTGTGPKGSQLAMDKDLSKKLFKQAGIPTADWVTINPNNFKLSNINIEFPLIVKPCNGGSSIGTYIVNNNEEIITAIEKAKKYEEKILIEKYIEGREFSVGILDRKVLPPIEIIPKEGFFDYKNKYQKDLTLEICPANLTEEENKRISEIALKVHECLELGSYSRIDFILKDNEFYCLEANTLPGMTPTSLLPQEAEVAGIKYNELCEIIIKLAFEDK